MIILVLNCGSSSIKYQLINMHVGADAVLTDTILAKGIVERIGQQEGLLAHKPTGKDPFKLQQAFNNHTEGINAILAALVDTKHGVITDVNDIEAIGHRVAHGGEYFTKSVLIDAQAKANIEKCAILAPLHNPAHLEGINAMEKLLPNKPQTAVFDTSFHLSMPEKAYFYSIPYEYYEKHKVRRYGFHGTSHQFVAQKACQMTGLDFNTAKIITCHMGNGASVAAIDGGKSVDTSMGFTPLEGLMMGTRCGDIDGGIVTFIQDTTKKDATGMNRFLNNECGLAGVSGISSDMRDLWKAWENDKNHRAKLALDMFIYRVAKYVGSYAAAMNGIDMVVFTGGIGENDWGVRAGIAAHLGFVGAEMDLKINDGERNDKVLNTPTSKIKLVLATTDEELVIAMDTVKLLKQL